MCLVISSSRLHPDKVPNAKCISKKAVSICCSCSLGIMSKYWFRILHETTSCEVRLTAILFGDVPFAKDHLQEADNASMQQFCIVMYEIYENRVAKKEVTH